MVVGGIGGVGFVNRSTTSTDCGRESCCAGVSTSGATATGIGLFMLCSRLGFASCIVVSIESIQLLPPFGVAFPSGV
jgi:predicted RND superfamily exporter protein